MLKKSLFIFSSFFLLSMTPLASKPFIGLNGGYTSFEKNFKSTFGLGTKIGIMNKEMGLSFDFSAQYYKTKAKENTFSEITIIPLSIGANYFFNPNRKITPYFGGFAAYNILNDDYKSGVGFGGRVGMQFKLDKDVAMYFEGVYQSIDTTFKKDDAKTKLSLSPLYIAYGINMSLGHSGKIYSGKKNEDQRKKERRRRGKKRDKSPRYY